ncbi:hypothetical protein AGMMS49928_29180 [Spirochaetia bacterium]|nr:hypothetical protein AGMMS49928_29180 [Spirochaetia bacterium]
MTGKLTLSLDAGVIEFAHDFSRKSQKSVSKIIEDYFVELKRKSEPELPKEVAELCGIIKGMNIPEKKELRRIFHEDRIS